MYSAHLHLLLNHWPIIGTFIGLGLFLTSLIANQDQLKQASLALFTLIALVALPAYMSGNSAQEFLRETPEVSMALIETHQGAALLALLFMEITGAFAWIGLLQFSRVGMATAGKAGDAAIQSEVRRPAGWVLAAVLLFSTVTSILMAITGNTGGEIRHPEIISDAQTASSVGQFGASVLPSLLYYFLEYSRWVWPIFEALHFFGLILIVASVGLLNLRILGFFKKLPVAPLQRFIPWGIAGFFINIFTGMLFFIGMPPFYANNPDFQLKILAIVIAGANLMLFYSTSAFHTLALVRAGDSASVSARLVAATSLFLWIAIIFLGRYIPIFEVPL